MRNYSKINTQNKNNYRDSNEPGTESISRDLFQSFLPTAVLGVVGWRRLEVVTPTVAQTCHCIQTKKIDNPTIRKWASNK